MYVFVDLETTGLRPAANVPLELGIVITDDSLEHVIEEQGWLWYWPGLDRNTNCYGIDDFIREFHDRSGLWDALIEGPRQDGIDIQKAAIEMLERNDALNQPMAGSSVHFDRRFLAEFLPKFEAKFHHRNIDVSSIKEFLRRIDERVVKARPHADSTHRAIPDCYDTAEELRFYKHYIFGKLS